MLLNDTLRFMRLALIIFKLSQDSEFNKQLNRRTDEQTGEENKMMCILHTLLPIHVSSFYGWRTEGRTEGKPIVPSGVNSGRGLINWLKWVLCYLATGNILIFFNKFGIKDCLYILFYIYQQFTMWSGTVFFRVTLKNGYISHQRYALYECEHAWNFLQHQVDPGLPE